MKGDRIIFDILDLIYDNFLSSDCIVFFKLGTGPYFLIGMEFAVYSFRVLKIESF